MTDEEELEKLEDLLNPEDMMHLAFNPVNGDSTKEKIMRSQSEPRVSTDGIRPPVLSKAASEKKELTLHSQLAIGSGELSPPIRPDNTLIAFDLHHVLFRPKYGQMARHLLSSPSKKQLVQLFSSPSFVKRFASETFTAVPEHAMQKLEEEDERVKVALTPLTMDFCNAQEPDIPTFELIKDLKGLGFKIYLLSNIGTVFFTDLRAKMPEALFTDFDGFYTTNPLDNYAKKPTPVPFQKFLERFNPDKKIQHMIFVDDSAENVATSNSLGFIGIQYKSAVLLRETFRSMSIPV